MRHRHSPPYHIVLIIIIICTHWQTGCRIRDSIHRRKDDDHFYSGRYARVAMLYHECPPHLSLLYFDRANNIQMRITTSGMCDRQDKAGRGGKDTIAIQHTYHSAPPFSLSAPAPPKIPGPGADVERGNFQSSWRLCGMNACVYIPRGRSSYMWTNQPPPSSFSLNHLRPLFHLLSRSEEDADEQKEECGGVRRVRDVDEMECHGSSRVLVHWPTRAA